MEQTNNFTKSLKLLAELEWSNRKDGGYTNDPTDPGGETKFGISKRAHPNVDIKNLTFDEACKIYIKEYWDACGCDSIPFPFCTIVFDTAVNCGTGRARDWMRKASDSKAYLELRKQYYIDIINKNTRLIKYARGWWNRLADLKKFVDVNQPDQGT